MSHLSYMQIWADVHITQCGRCLYNSPKSEFSEEVRQSLTSGNIFLFMKCVYLMPSLLFNGLAYSTFVLEKDVLNVFISPNITPDFQSRQQMQQLKEGDWEKKCNREDEKLTFGFLIVISTTEEGDSSRLMTFRTTLFLFFLFRFILTFIDYNQDFLCLLLLRILLLLDIVIWVKLYRICEVIVWTRCDRLAFVLQSPRSSVLRFLRPRRKSSSATTVPEASTIFFKTCGSRSISSMMRSEDGAISQHRLIQDQAASGVSSLNFYSSLSLSLLVTATLREIEFSKSENPWLSRIGRRWLVCVIHNLSLLVHYDSIVEH